MRVAVFTETFLPKMDGIVRVVCLLLDHLQRRNIETIVFAPRLLDGSVSDYNSAPVIALPGITLPLYPELRICPPSLRMHREFKAFQPDVAHFIHPVTVGLPGMWMAKRQRIPTLASFHLDLAQMATHHRLPFLRPLTNLVTRSVFNWADYALAPSKRVQTELQALGVRDVGLWKRGVDAETFNPRYRDAAMRDQLSDGHPDDILLLYVGRLSAEKHVDKLRAVLERVPGTRLAIVGHGPARDQLEAHFAGTPTKFMGEMKGEPLSQAYASADVFTFASALETFGLVVLEAMAAGLPVVSSRVGGIPDVVNEGETGYLFDVGDVEGLVAGVEKIVTDRDNLRRMGQAARAFAETQNWPAMMEEVITHYERLIAANQQQ